MSPYNKQIMKAKAFGTIAISFFITSISLAVIQMVYSSVILATLYLIICITQIIIISAIFCSKCLTRDNCIHIFMGPLSKLLSKKKTGKYKTKDILMGVVIPLFLIYTIPQYWLLKNILYFSSFWIISGVGIVILLTLVCTRCGNTKCTFCKNK